LAYRSQAATLGGLDKEALRIVRQPKGETLNLIHVRPFEARIPATREGATLRAASLLTREWNGKLERVMVLEKGFAWNGKSYRSLSRIAKAMTGTSWNGHRFFGLRTVTSSPSTGKGRRERSNDTDAPAEAASIGPVPDREVRRRASPDEARAPAGAIAVAHPEGRRRDTAGSP
jgi:hypothetical protein